MRSLLDSLYAGMRSLAAHKLRSGLTMLGVIFGVSAVVSMISIATGAERAALAQIRLLGANTIRVVHVELDGEVRDRAEQRGSRGLRASEAEPFRSLPGVVGVAPVRVLDLPVLRRTREALGHILATDDEYAVVTELRVSHGRFLSALDVREEKRVAVIGAAIRDELFGRQDPVGHSIYIGGELYTVVGWMEHRAARGTRAGPISLRQLGRDIYLPITTASRRLADERREGGIDEIAVRVAGDDLVPPIAEILARLVDGAHRGVEDFEIRIPSDLLESVRGTQRVFNVVMGSIAAISLIVGGIGIMNVMLTTVTERTREIGIRRATGASQRAILRQFLTETVLLSGAGGVLGILLGLGMAVGIERYAGWETAASWGAILVAFALSAIVGIVFGLYPARRAARMDPIAALRFE